MHVQFWNLHPWKPKETFKRSANLHQQCWSFYDHPDNVWKSQKNLTLKDIIPSIKYKNNYCSTHSKFFQAEISPFMYCWSSSGLGVAFQRNRVTILFSVWSGLKGPTRGRIKQWLDWFLFTDGFTCSPNCIYKGLEKGIICNIVMVLTTPFTK